LTRLTDKQAVISALHDAIQWQTEFRNANVGFDDEQVAHCDRYIAAYRRTLGRITGSKASAAEVREMIAFKDVEVMSVQQIQRAVDAGAIKIENFGDSDD
jgi:low affinity Fe/Cu permease